MDLTLSKDNELWVEDFNEFNVGDERVYGISSEFSVLDKYTIVNVIMTEEGSWDVVINPRDGVINTITEQSKEEVWEIFDILKGLLPDTDNKILPWMGDELV